MRRRYGAAKTAVFLTYVIDLLCLLPPPAGPPVKVVL